ncbi:hypothetical protein JCM12856_23300 [Spirochaeta dissipatitropha]
MLNVLVATSRVSFVEIPVSDFPFILFTEAFFHELSPNLCIKVVCEHAFADYHIGHIADEGYETLVSM